MLRKNHSLTWGRLAFCFLPYCQELLEPASLVGAMALENKGMESWNPRLTPDSSEPCLGMASWVFTLMNASHPFPCHTCHMHTTHSTKGRLYPKHQTRGEILRLRRSRQLFCSSSLKLTLISQISNGTWRNMAWCIVYLHGQWVLKLPRTYAFNYSLSGLPWWLSGKESACHWKRHGFNPWSRKIPHAVEELSPCITTMEPMLWSPGTAAIETVHRPGSCSARREATVMRGPRAATTEKTPLTTTRKKPVWQWRPSTAKNKELNNILTQSPHRYLLSVWSHVLNSQFTIIQFNKLPFRRAFCPRGCP